MSGQIKKYTVKVQISMIMIITTKLANIYSVFTMCESCPESCLILMAILQSSYHSYLYI